MTPATAATMRAASSDWEALMAAAQDGDADAYERLLRALRPLLQAMARRRLGNGADAEDAVQDTLLTIHRLRHTYDPRRPLRPWIAAICQRRCVDHRRRAGRATVMQLSAEGIADRMPAQSGDAAMLHLEALELHEAVALLPPAQRGALRLAKFEQLSLAEASARSGRSATAIKVATHRAIRSLRLRLSPARA